ncbi:MAG: ATP-binding protein [Burkholderiaceae bacterium]
MRIALVGAESTGKSTLAAQLAAKFRATGLSVTVVDEVLREWCGREGRTPRRDEQMAIAQEQARRSRQARADVVISDATSVMIAVYSDMLFGDSSLYDFALAHQRSYDVTLLTGLDLPWVADPLRDGPHVREPVDALVRAALTAAGITWHGVYGTGEERVRNALRGIHAAAGNAQANEDGRSMKAWQCEKCSDPQCEHRLFTGLLASKAAGRPPA